MSNPTATVTQTTDRLKYEVEVFLLGGAFELYEDDRLIAAVEADHALAEVSYGKLILSCWGDGWSRSWRVVRSEAGKDRLRLGCTKQMGRAIALVELRRGASICQSHSRDEFRKKLPGLIEANLTGLKVERAILARDAREHLSGVYTRLVLRERGRVIAGVGIGEHESQSLIDATLGAGLVWLSALRRAGKLVERLMIFAPQGRANTIATRMTAVDSPGARISLYETDEASGSLKPLAPFDQGDLNDNLRHAAARAIWLREGGLSRELVHLIESIIHLAPDLIETRRKGGWITCSIRGLEFARVSLSRLRAEFGLYKAMKKLTEDNQDELAELVSGIATKRVAGSDSHNDVMYRAQSEAWLESIIRKDVSAIDPTLDPRYAYSQVPAYRGEQRAFIDLLAVTRAGRLVVIEIKVAEDAEFPFQGLDYWLRVEWHARRGDFERRGYFKGLKLAACAPLLYLVAPLFRFHATTRLIGGSISHRVPVYRIAVNDDWRSGLRVLLSERLN